MKSYLYKKFVEAKRLLFVVVYLLPGVTINAQPNINRIEYYLDTDPGYGNATNLSFSGTNNATATINLDLTPVATGVHIIGIRSRDANGAWSLDNKWIFLKPYPNVGATPQPNINRVEWFLDTDPGYGNATPISIVPAQNLASLAINIDLAPLNQGVHIVGIRSRDATGAWSLDNKWIFLKPYPNVGATPQPNINRVEWFLDTDPGYGNATPITIVPAQNLAALSINIDLAPLSQGVHIVGVRSLDANGAWSLDNKWIFLKPYTNAGATPQPKIVRVEYYVDGDPGYGNGTPITITSATNISNLIFDANISNVSNGAHKLGIRSLDENGAWSVDNQVDFTKSATSTYTWTGNTSNAWTNAANWSSGVVPTASIDVIIPANRPNNPVIANAVLANCKSITISPGAAITVATGGNLKVNQ